MRYTRDARIRAMVCYLWPIGLIFFFLYKKDPFVRFNAAQAIVMLGIEIVIWLICLIPLAALGVVYWLVTGILFLFSLIAVINCWNGGTFRIPFVADLSDRLIATF